MTTLAPVPTIHLLTSGLSASRPALGIRASANGVRVRDVSTALPVALSLDSQSATEEYEDHAVRIWTGQDSPHADSGAHIWVRVAKVGVSARNDVAEARKSLWDMALEAVVVEGLRAYDSPTAPVWHASVEKSGGCRAFASITDVDAYIVGIAFSKASQLPI